MLKYPISPFVLRGVLGGAIGWVLLFTLAAFINPWSILALPYAPLIGAVAGAIIGVVMWVCFNLAERELGVIIRALVGAGLVLIVLGLFILSEGRKKPAPVFVNSETTARQEEIAARKSRPRHVTLAVLIALLGGAIPGGMARPKSRRRETDES